VKPRGDAAPDVLAQGSALPFALATALAVSAVAAYQVQREFGYFCLGLAASSFLLPKYAPELRTYWLPALTAVVPLSIVAAISLAVADEPRTVPTTGLVFIWLAACVCYPLLISNAVGPRFTLPNVNLNASWLLPILLICTIGAVLRFAWLNEAPSPFSGDEAIFVIQGFERAAGAPLNHFASGHHGSATMYFQLVAWAQAAPTSPETATRMLSATFGTLAVAFTFLFLKEAYRTDVALAGAAFIAVIHFHIHYSRQALPNVDDSLIASGALYFTLRALHRKDLRSFAIAGLVGGLAPYAWTSARVLPLALVVMLGAGFLRGPNRAKIAGGILVFVAGALMVAGPILAWWQEHPDEFKTRESQVFIYADPLGPKNSWYADQREAGESTWDIYSGQFHRGIEAVLTGPEVSEHFNSEIGMFGVLPSLLLVAGLILACVRPQPADAALITLFAASFIGGAMLVVPQASSARLLGLAVPGAAFVGLASAALAGLSGNVGHSRREALALAITVLAAMPGLFYYFGDWRSENRFGDTQNRVANSWGNDLRAQLNGHEHLVWFDSNSLNSDQPILRLKLRDHPIVLVGQDGRVIRRSLPLDRTTSTGELIVVATGDRVSNWSRDSPECGNQPVLRDMEAIAGFPRLVVFRPAPACAAALATRYELPR
jgi:hypothetical protein